MPLVSRTKARRRAKSSPLNSNARVTASGVALMRALVLRPVRARAAPVS